MRIVLDTNVLISAAIKQNSYPERAVYIAAEQGTLLKSVTTEQELLATLMRPRLQPLIPERFRAWLVETLMLAELVEINERIAACRDPKDDKFLELAVSGRADIIVTGDADLLTLHPFRAVEILSPAAFVSRSS